VKVKDRSVIVTTDAETKVSQPSSLQELIDKETGKDQLNYILQGVTVLHCTLWSLIYFVLVWLIFKLWYHCSQLHPWAMLCASIWYRRCGTGICRGVYAGGSWQSRKICGMPCGTHSWI